MTLSRARRLSSERTTCQGAHEVSVALNISSRDFVVLSPDEGSVKKASMHQRKLGGDIAIRGYQGQVDTYRDARMFDQATEKCVLGRILDCHHTVDERGQQVDGDQILAVLE